MISDSSQEGTTNEPMIINIARRLVANRYPRTECLIQYLRWGANVILLIDDCVLLTSNRAAL
jgi:hypothetical protein